MSFPAELDIGDRRVGPGHPTYVIAEAGANHNRDFDTARRLIDVAAEAGLRIDGPSQWALDPPKTPRRSRVGLGCASALLLARRRYLISTILRS